MILAWEWPGSPQHISAAMQMYDNLRVEPGVALLRWGFGALGNESYGIILWTENEAATCLRLRYAEEFKVLKELPQ